MRYPTLHGFLKWIPTAIGGAGLGIAAIWSEAKDWISAQVVWGWQQMSDPWIATAVILFLCAYIWAIIWTGQSPKAKQAMPGVVLVGEGLDHVRVEYGPARGPYETRFFPVEAPQNSGLIVWIIEKIRNFFHKELQAETAPVASLVTGFVPAEIPIWKAVEHVRAVIGDNNEDDCYPEARRQLRQAAERGRITLSGRKELKPPKIGYASDIWTEIHKAYWQDHELNPLATGVMFADHDHTNPEPLIVDGYRQRYWSVMARKGEIEGVWPRSANVGFDTTFHHLVRHVAIESKWAGAFVLNDSSDYLIRMLDDPWDALKREICGPLIEGRLKARGVHKPAGGPEENAFDDIPAAFWKTAQFSVQDTLLDRRVNGASGAGGLFLGIIVQGEQVEEIWPRRDIDEQASKQSPFVELARELEKRRAH